MPLKSTADRFDVTSGLLVACFAAVFLLSSQSAASLLTYVLALSVIFTARSWSDAWHVRYLWLIVAVVGYLALSSLWSTPLVWREVLSTMVRALLVIAFVIAFAEVQHRGLLQLWLRRGLALVGGVAAVAALALFVLADEGDGRLSGLGQLDTAVVAAVIFGVVLIVALQLAIKERGIWRWLGAATVALCIVSVALSDSRNAWMSVVCGAVVLVAAESTRDRQRFLAVLALFVLMTTVVLLALYLGDSTREFLLPRGLSFRPEIWQAAVAKIAQHGIWFGLGVNTPDDFQVGAQLMQHPHNLYLAVAYQGGLVGLVLFVVLIWQTCRTLLEQYHDSDAKLALAILGAALPAFLLDFSQLVDKIGATWFLFWLPVGIALGHRWSGLLRD